jgi:hypothetical protein
MFGYSVDTVRVLGNAWGQPFPLGSAEGFMNRDRRENGISPIEIAITILPSLGWHVEDRP